MKIGGPLAIRPRPSETYARRTNTDPPPTADRRLPTIHAHSVASVKNARYGSAIDLRNSSDAKCSDAHTSAAGSAARRPIVRRARSAIKNVARNPSSAGASRDSAADHPASPPNILNRIAEHQ